MAQILQRRYSLPVVRITVDTVEGEPRADLCLVVNVDGRQEIQSQSTFDLAAFGCVDNPGTGDPDLRVPDPVCAWVADWVAHLRAGSPQDASAGPAGASRGPAALWLHFVRPHGSLGAVPWERDLQPRVGMPLLRLPDVLPDPDRSGSTFDVALVATSVHSEGLSAGARTAPDVARAIAEGVGPRLRLHVFVESEAYAPVEEALAGLAAREVTVHRAGPVPPETPRTRTTPVPPASAPAVDNAWLRWVRRAMGGLTLDAVHFVLQGFSLGYDGALLTPSSPAWSDRGLPRTLQAGELLGFLNQVGALSATFTRPTDNHSDHGLRQLVDELSLLRAGPVVLHDPRLDPELMDLREAYRFLSAPGQARAPATPSLVMCVQPHRVLRELDDVEMPPGDLALRSSPAVKEQFERDRTPMWLSAAERYIEQWESDLIKFRRSSAERSPTPVEVSYYAGVETALHKIRDVVNRHAEELR